MKKIVMNKKFGYTVLAIAVVALGALGIMKSPRTVVPQAKADNTGQVPQFGVNVGDYSSCMNKYVADDTLGSTYSGDWTPVGGGQENGFGTTAYSNDDKTYTGDCIQAGMVTNATNVYTEDFRVGIRVAPGLAAGAPYGRLNGSTVGTDCLWSAGNGWHYTDWASNGGGQSGVSGLEPGYDWGIECVQLTVDTRPIPAGAGITAINSPSFGITIASADGSQTETSIAASTCYLNSPNASYDKNYAGHTPSCYLSAPITDGSFHSAYITLHTNSLGAQEFSTNIPATTTPSQVITTGTNGQPLSITMKNTGSVAWVPSFTGKDVAGTQTGTCKIDRNGDGVNDAPPSTDPVLLHYTPADDTTCTVTTNLVADNYSLNHISGSFAVNPQNIPLAYSNVTKTTTYIPAHNVTISIPCDNPGGPLGAMAKDNNSLLSFLLSKAYALGVGGGGSTPGQKCTDTEEVDEEWVVDYSGGGYQDSIAPEQTYTFPITSMTAPSTSSTYNETWQMTDAPFGDPFVYPIIVGGAVPTGNASGTITVNSENAILPNVPVPAKWDILDGSSDICDQGQICQGYSQAYRGQPAIGASVPPGAGNITMPYGSIVSTGPGATSLYSFNSVQLVPNHKIKLGFIGQTLTLARDIFGSTAQAFSVPVADPLSQTLVSGGTVPFVILWNPIASMGVTPSSLTLTSVTGSSASQVIQVNNNGAPGSTLTWTATPSAGWLSASPATDGSGLTNGASGNASENVNIIADASGLGVGTHSATIKFSGTSAPGVLPPGAIVQIVTVTYKVTAAVGGSGYDCVSNACSAVASNAQYSTLASCNAACGSGGGSSSTITGVTVSCSPSSIDTTQTSQCSATITGTGSFDPTPIWSIASGPGTISGTGKYTPPASVGGPTTVTIKATSKQDPTKSGTTPITVNNSLGSCTPGVNCPVCANPALSANPTSIVVPESSQLQYYCQHITSCSLTGTDGSNYPVTTAPDGTYTGSTAIAPVVNATGTQSVSPASSTLYTLSCFNINYGGPNANVSSTVNITVGGLGRCEQNPNGVGCPKPQL